MTPERERWAIALLLERQHGEAALSFVADRIAALNSAGDSEGVSRWQSISAALAALRGNNADVA